MDLPPEIVEIIIEFLRLDPSPGPILRTCALISRVWVIPARRSLWTTFDVIKFQRPHRTLDQLKTLVSSPHTTLPFVKTRELHICRGYLDDVDITTFLEWCETSFRKRNGEHEELTVAQALFGSTATLRLTGIQIEREEGDTILYSPISQTAKSSLLHSFPSVTELYLHDVHIAFTADFWDIFRAFGPTLEKLEVGYSTFPLFDAHKLEPSNLRTNRTPSLPLLRSLEFDLRDSSITQLISCCIPSPSLQKLTCQFSPCGGIDDHKSAIRMLGELLSSTPNLREVVFMDGTYLYDQQSEAIRDHLKILEGLPALTHLTLQFSVVELAYILSLSKPHHTIISLTIPNLVLISDTSSFDSLIPLLRKLPSLKELCFDFEVALERWELGGDSDWYHLDSDPEARVYCRFKDGLVPRQGSVPWTKAQNGFNEFARLMPCSDTRKLLRPSFSYEMIYEDYIDSSDW